VPALPPVESLTFDADFTAFMKPDVDPSLKRAALKKLFSDPRFNVMDGLDVYIDDYTKFEPLDAETARSLVSARYIFDPPKTRVNERARSRTCRPRKRAGSEAQDAQARSAARDARTSATLAGRRPRRPDARRRAEPALAPTDDPTR
jgi:hypothetical protein